jgi:superfamily II DNA or RNA helicase
VNKPLHPKASHFYEIGLFDNLTSFNDLELKISSLPGEYKYKGDAFEVFVEAYLNTHPNHLGSTQVWPGCTVPVDIVDKLVLTSNDYGVDGIYKTALGEYHGYQVKFRSKRKSLSWSGDHLSNFIGQADRCNHRVVITNSDDIDDVTGARLNFSSVKGADFDNLVTPDGFDRIRCWLSGSIPVAAKIFTPRDDQATAIDKITHVLATQDRATTVMACGSGKTLVALWVAERQAAEYGAKNVLVLVPSLALMKQTLHQWAAQTSIQEFAYICICSDKTVQDPNDDAIILKPSDLDFPVSTDCADVEAFFNHTYTGTRFVFATYQSAREVAKGLPDGVLFDFAVFDEAHKTTGHQNGLFGFALDNQNIYIKKRLFMTATPRKYDVRRRDKEGDASLVYSMDNEAVYGPVAYRLSFYEAMKLGVICGYKILYSVVTSAEIPPDLLPTSDTEIKGVLVKTQQVAHQIAIQKAVERYGATKIISFHGSIKAAESFTSESIEGIGTHLNDFHTLHVNGSMNAGKRTKILDLLKSHGKAIISNARCLTEGVDVPAVDMVAFVTRKRSKVDIVQAAGRAMRLAPGKETGYILVPLFLDLAAGENIETALKRSEFEYLWEVLEAIKDYDEDLADIIREMRVEKGRGRGYNDNRLHEKIEVLSDYIPLDVLKRGITAECIEWAGSSWDENFGKLVAFHEINGHCRVPQKKTKVDPAFTIWVGTQRKRQANLSPDRKSRLNSIGFVWSVPNPEWEENYVKLVAFHEVNGHCRVPQRYKEDPYLGSWVNLQRHKQNKLSVDRKIMLDCLSFDWNVLDTNWEGNFAKLVAFHEVNGHCRVPQRYKEDSTLSTWVSTQRKTRADLSDDRKSRLDSLGFIWNMFDLAWDKNYAKLEAYHAANGHCRVKITQEDDPGFALWVVNLRNKRNKLPLDCISKLDNLGFIWDVFNAVWEENFEKLIEFHKVNGHCNVPTKGKENSLGKWIRSQRARQDNLSLDRKSRLDSLGFVWNMFDASWEENYAKLVEFHADNGHCRVKGNPALEEWIVKQRMQPKNLSPDRKSRLDCLGFVWNVLDTNWEKIYDKLVAFHAVNGHSRVLRGYKEDLTLATWVSVQRKRQRQDRMPPDQKKKLDALDFLWEF